MTGEAEKPNWVQCPPFPDFTGLERRLLEAVAEGQMAGREQEFRQQLAQAKVISREHTVVGFYTHIEGTRSCTAITDLAGASGAWVVGGGAHLEVPGVELGLCTIVWFPDGYLDCIEGVTYGDGQHLPAALADLQITSLQLN